VRRVEARRPVPVVRAVCCPAPEELLVLDMHLPEDLSGVDLGGLCAHAVAELRAERAKRAAVYVGRSADVCRHPPNG
jgi:hypothetical protein